MELPQTPSFRLEGRRALVVGASSGIGLGAAVALAEAGAVVNSAGTANHKPALETTAEDYKGVMDTNVRGAYFVSVAAAQKMVASMVKAMAIEWGPENIRINTICPTFIKTPLTKVTFDNPERVEWIKSKLKLDRIGEIKDIMGCVLYLAGDASSMVTGTSHLIDGGWTAG